MLRALNPISRSADIVLVIDTIKSMRPIIKKLQQVGSWRSAFKRQSNCRIEEYQKYRFKVIWFRDFHFSNQNVYGESEFFDIINGESEFIDYFNKLENGGKAGSVSFGLEALYIAMNSDFNKKANKVRHIIVLLTDKSAHPLEHQNRNLFTNNLSYMPKSYEDFYNEWEPHAYPLGGLEPKLDIREKRLFLVTPLVYPWDNLMLELDKTVLLDISQDNGRDDSEIDNLLYYLNYALA